MNITQFVMGLPLLVQMLITQANKKGVQTYIGGNQACTDGSTVHLPTIHLPKRMEDASQWVKLALAYLGYAAHEVGHVLWSDFRVFDLKTPALLKDLANDLEDARIDRVHVEDRPGLVQAFESLAQLLIDDELEKPVTDQDHALDVALGFVHFWLRVHINREEPYRPLLATTEAALVKKLPRGAQVALKAILPRAHHLQSTRAAATLAQEILAMLKAESEKPDEEEQSQPQPGVPGNGVAVPGGPGGSGTGPGSQGQGQGSPSPAQALAAALAAGNHRDFGGTRTQMIKEVLVQQSKKAEKSGKTHDVRVTAHETGGKETRRQLALDTEGCIDFPAVMGASSVLRSRMAALLEARTLEDTDHARRGRRLDDRLLHRIPTGYRNVFVRKREEVDLNTAIVLLLDVSSSMISGDAIKVAREAALAACEAVEPIRNVVCAAAVFPGLAVLKRFEQRCVEVRRRFEVSAWGGTPMADGLVLAAKLFEPRDESRKILIVCTDGAPDHAPSVLGLLQTLQTRGIESVGLGIGTSSVRHLFPVSQVLSGVGELPAALMATLKSQLLAAA